MHSRKKLWRGALCDPGPGEGLEVMGLLAGNGVEAGIDLAQNVVNVHG